MTTILTIEPLAGGLIGGATHKAFGGAKLDLRGRLTAPWLGQPAGTPVVKVPGSSISVIARNLDNLIRQYDGDVLVAAYSKGAHGFSRWLDQYADKHPPEFLARIRALLFGNPLRRYGGHGVGAPELDGKIGTATRSDTPCRIIDVAMERDGWADAPTRPGCWTHQHAHQDRWFINLWWAIHANAYNDADLNNPARKVFHEGNTEYRLLPCKPLPQFRWLKRSTLDAGFDRPER